MTSRTKIKKPAANPTSTPLASARKALESGDIAQAEQKSLALLKKNPASFEAMETLALVRLRQGQTKEALVLLGEVAALTPSNPNAHLNLGNVLLVQKHYEAAIAAFDKVIELSPDHTAALVNRGAALDQLGRKDEALASYESALKVDSRMADALNNAGTILNGFKRHDEAIDYYKRALKARPEFAEALNNLAVSLVAVDRKDEALEKYAEAVRIKPNYVDAVKNRAELLAVTERYEESLGAYNTLIALTPSIAELHNNRCTVLISLNRHQEALADCDQALALRPDYADALSNRGIILTAQRRYAEALQCFQKAVVLEPENVNAHWNESLASLRLGRFKEGWQTYEWRWKKPEFEQHKQSFTQPKWQGKEDLSDKAVLVLSEQGFGDAIQFSRYLPLLEAKGARVSFFVPEGLVDLMRSSFPRVNVFSKAAKFPPFDYYCHLLSLPLAFGTLLESVPASIPYLKANGQRRINWGTRFGNPAKTTRVGIAWAGSASHKNDLNRSISLESFSKVLSTPNCTFYSLQKEISEPDRALLNEYGVTLLGNEFRDFSDTAAAMEQLDLVISVDTSVAHLAGALGKPVWLLIPQISDWRWLPDRTDNPWYPTARLYWQTAIGQWKTALANVADDLRTFTPIPASARQTELSLDDAIRTAFDLNSSGKPEDAEAICKGILQVQPFHFDALQLLGSLHLQRKRVEEAIACYQKSLGVKPDDIAALANLAGAFRIANRHDDAYPLYDRGQQLAPGNASILTNRAVSLIAQKRYDEALESLRKALAIDPAYLAALNNQGVVLNELRRFDEALQSYDAALEVKPGFPDALINRGLALIGLNRPQEAEQHYLEAIVINPLNASAYNNRGNALAALNRVEEALACFRKAQEIDPSYVDAHWNESLMSLVIGNYSDGWPQYEWRWKKPEFLPHRRDFSMPQWTGKESIKGQTIFIHFEQGFGDVIQFSRYIDLLQAQGAKVLMSTTLPLRRLLESSFPTVDFFIGGDVTQPFHFFCPLLSLPLALGTTLENIPASRFPYLQAPDSHRTTWQTRIPATDKVKVGLVWSGNPKHQNDRNRSLPLVTMAKLLQLPELQFYSLQKESTEEDKALLDTYGVSRIGEQFEDFCDTAAAIEQLDLVISVDTSVAHLAGALGKPLWLLLAFAPDWRWLLEREDSPWYPSARIFRQSEIGHWEPLVQKICTEITRFKNDFDPRSRTPTYGNSSKASADPHGDRILERFEPVSSQDYNALGGKLAAQGCIQEAMTAFGQARSLDAGNVDAQVNLGMMNLLLGNYEEGWKLYEKRWLKPEFEPAMRDFESPQWSGTEDLRGKTIFLRFEQGLGDAIQFSRYIDLLDALGAKVIMSLPDTLHGIFRRSFPTVGFYGDGAVLPPYEYHIPLLSLPLVFGTTLSSIPSRHPYLLVPKDRLAHWQSQLPKSSELKIGLVWSGNPATQTNAGRSIPLPKLKKLLEAKGCRFYSLKNETTIEDRVLLDQLDISPIGEQFSDCSDTAAAIMQLDLVISVCTSVTHLAAALGKPVWLLLQFSADWRWLQNREDSPWYPTVRIFRQQQVGQWEPVAQKLSEEIRRLQNSLPAGTQAALSFDQAFEVATSLYGSGNHADAELVCKGILQSQPTHPGALTLLETLAKDKLLAGIQQRKKKALAEPDNLEAKIDLAIAFEVANHYEEALQVYQQCLSKQPDYLPALRGQCLSLYKSGRLTEALDSLRKALVQNPDDIKLLNNCGIVLNELDSHERALACFDRALEINPEYFKAISGRETALIALNRAMEAIQCDKQMLRLKPDKITPHVNEGLMNLLLGNFREGWRQFESRWQMPEFAGYPKFQSPRLADVNSLTGKTVTILAEQGFGDSLQFVRYLGPLTKAAATVNLLAPQALVSLLRHNFPLVNVAEKRSAIPSSDFHSSLMSLPMVFDTTLETIPAGCPYLRAPESSVAKWKLRILPSNKLSVGLVWSGNPIHQLDRKRSLPLAAFTDLLQTKSCSFYSLQKEVTSDERALLDKHGITQLGDRFEDFSDTAAAIMQLDLVISVDTSVAHLTGALGKPIWILLPFAPDWRWLLNREDSPWYPTARLFRQLAIGDVNGQLLRIVKAIRQLISDRQPAAARSEKSSGDSATRPAVR